MYKTTHHTIKHRNITRHNKLGDISMFRNYDDIVTVDQLCEMLAIGKTTAYKLIKNKNIQSFTIGKCIRIYKNDIITYIMKKNV